MNIDSLRELAVLDGERLKTLWTTIDRQKAALDLLLAYIHVDIRDKALQILSGAVQPSGDT